MEHLIKIAACPDAIDVPHWRSDVQNVHYSASAVFSPSMRQLVDMRHVWLGGRKLEQVSLLHRGVDVSDSTICLFVLDDLIADDFDLDARLATILTMMKRDRPRRASA